MFVTIRLKTRAYRYILRRQACMLCIFQTRHLLFCILHWPLYYCSADTDRTTDKPTFPHQILHMSICVTSHSSYTCSFSQPLWFTRYPSLCILQKSPFRTPILNPIISISRFLLTRHSFLTTHRNTLHFTAIQNNE
jgi:hypothetical protein